MHLRDLKQTLISLAGNPLFTAVAVVSLALGIGANTAIFSIFDQVLLRVLPVEDPRSLVMIATRGSHMGNNRGSNALSYPMYRDYRDRNQVFTGVLCRRGEMVNLSHEGSTERLEAELVSGNYFEVLGVRPAAGRVFTARDETAPGANPVVVLSNRYWRERFKSNSKVIGTTIQVNNYPMEIVGVSAEGFKGMTLGYEPSVFVPVTMKKQVTPTWDALDDRRSRWVQVFARLKPGVSMEQAEASIRPLYKQIIAGEVQEAAFSQTTNFGRQQFLRSYAVVLPGGQGYSGMRRAMGMPMKIMLGMVFLVLLITCANVSNLMVARAAGRRKELAIRLAMGASRARVAGVMMIESTVIALAGGAAALLVAYWTTRGIISFAPNEQARLALSAALDGRVLLFGLLLSALSAVLFGLIPALHASRTELAETMKEQSAAAAAGHGGRLRKALVAAQVMLSFVLLVLSGLLVQSLGKLEASDPGFTATNLIRFKSEPPLSGYDKPRTTRYFEQLKQTLENTPGVESVAFAVVAIMEGNEWDSTVNVEGYRAKDGEDMNPHFNSVTPDYFKTMRIKLVAGREFTARDQFGGLKVGVVNRTFAKRYFGQQNPVGRHFGFGGGPTAKADIEIVGVVEDAKYESLKEEIPRQVFVASAQQEWTSEMTGYVRTRLQSDQMFQVIRREAQQLDSAVPIYDISTMEDQLDRSLAIEKFSSFLSGLFGLLATVLAVVGLYGVTSYNVTRRSREIGLRVALGATRARVVGMVLREVLLLAGIGMAVALPLTWWLSQLLRSQLFGIDPRDPVTMGAVVAGLAATSVLAGLGPALRASRTDPAEVLRYE